MVFWKTYPLFKFIETFKNENKFKDLSFEKNNLESPTGYHVELINNLSDSKTMIQIFLKTYFGNPPYSPILDIPESQLIQENDYILFVRDNQNSIAGCVRYHYMGKFISDKAQKIYIVDCFCIHPKWRKKGVGDYLLTSLHRFANNIGIPHCIFLKEGNILSILSQPFYSGIYKYKQVENKNLQNVKKLSIEDAYHRINIFQRFYPDLFIIRNKSSTNQYWILYKKDKYMVLACIQDTYQWYLKNKQKQKMGWITCWIESPNMNISIRAEASEQIVDSMFGVFDSIWINSEWSGNSNKWIIDGPFHWYSYQWTTSLSIKSNYCILH